VVDPWKSLGFAPPKDAAGYQALGRAQQNAIQAVIRNWDCRNAPPDRPGTPIVACDLGRTAKYLLGPAIVTGDQIQSASVLSPNASIGQFEYTVMVNLTAAGQQQWTSYTTQHNEQAHPADDANVVADVLDGDVLVASTIEETITGGITQITGNFTQRSATVLAGFLSAGVLPASFEVVSIRPD
jgi:preprotein translocase subunit SecD